MPIGMVAGVLLGLGLGLIPGVDAVARWLTTTAESGARAAADLIAVSLPSGTLPAGPQVNAVIAASVLCVACAALLGAVRASGFLWRTAGAAVAGLLVAGQAVVSVHALSAAGPTLAGSLVAAVAVTGALLVATAPFTPRMPPAGDEPQSHS